MNQKTLNYIHWLRQLTIHDRLWRTATTATLAMGVFAILAPAADAAQIIMYWDRGHLDGLAPTAGMEIWGNHHGNQIEIPAHACGFRLGKPNHDWDGGWHFAEPQKLGSPVKYNGLTYSSSWFGTGPGPIEAIGPINGNCNTNTGLYQFQTPASSSITGSEMPPGAGSFVADVYDGSDIEWLDSRGKPIEIKEKKPLKPPKLPKEFFEDLSKQGCIQDFEQKQHCEKQSALMPKPGDKIRPISLASAPSSQTMLAVINPNTASSTASSTARQSNKIEMSCPAELILKGTISKAHGFDPATVEYRFRWSHGPVSTVFSTFVAENTASVLHKVPLPLPAPVQGGSTPGRGGAGVQTIAPVFQSGGGGGGGSGSSHSISPVFTDKPLPSNEHKSAVRLEIVNIENGDVVTSNWWNYHVACKPRVNPGIGGPRNLQNR